MTSLGLSLGRFVVFFLTGIPVTQLWRYL
jgi:hypothetical protein